MKLPHDLLIVAPEIKFDSENEKAGFEFLLTWRIGQIGMCL